MKNSADQVHGEKVSGNLGKKEKAISSSVKQGNSLKMKMRRGRDTIVNKFCEWPACYSMALTCLVSGVLIHYETVFGAKIASFSTTQMILILLVICIVAKNVFIPSRANRFIEKSTQPSTTDTGIDA